jgi:hypothetical protein
MHDHGSDRDVSSIEGSLGSAKSLLHEKLV